MMEFVFSEQEAVVHRAIRRHMGVRLQNDNMPVISKYGTRQDLADCWSTLGYARGVEIGTLRGDYAKEILARNPQCHLTCIDPWLIYDHSKITEGMHHRNYDKTVKRLQPWLEEGRCDIIKRKSMEAVDMFDDESLDFVYIDGDHCFDAVAMDIIRWNAKVRPGGMIACHDYIPLRRGGVVQAVDAFTFCHNIRPWYVARELLSTAFWVKPEKPY